MSRPRLWAYYVARPVRGDERPTFWHPSENVGMVIEDGGYETDTFEPTPGLWLWLGEGYAVATTRVEDDPDFDPEGVWLVIKADEPEDA